MDAEPASLIGAGRHHAAAVRPAAYDHRPAPEAGIVTLFDGGKEGVHIDMYDFSLAVHADCPVRSIRVCQGAAVRNISRFLMQIK